MRKVSESALEMKGQRAGSARPASQGLPPTAKPPCSTAADSFDEGAARGQRPFGAGDRPEAGSGNRIGVLATSARGWSGKPLLLECYENGVFLLLDFAAARRQLWQVDFGWVLPTDWFRCGWGGHEDSDLVRPRTGDCGREFGLALLTHPVPLTFSMMRKLVRRWTEDTDAEAFIARAARFNQLFPKWLRRAAPLYVYYPMPTAYGMKEPAYRLAEERSTLVIAGVDPDCGVPTELVDWPALQKPPGACAEGEPETDLKK